MTYKIFFGAIAAGTMAIAVPTYAQNAAEETAEDGDRPNAARTIVCRRYAAPTGTRIGTRRICKTQAEWTRLDMEARVAIERNQVNRCQTPGDGICNN
ncbi:MAG: hypothetical protein HKN78_09840 [Sphingomonadaceae bacterium]|nr:hypothetical protein [Sphingomonadaceae bacterium]